MQVIYLYRHTTLWSLWVTISIWYVLETFLKPSDWNLLSMLHVLHPGSISQSQYKRSGSNCSNVFFTHFPGLAPFLSAVAPHAHHKGIKVVGYHSKLSSREVTKSPTICMVPPSHPATADDWASLILPGSLAAWFAATYWHFLCEILVAGTVCWHLSQLQFTFLLWCTTALQKHLLTCWEVLHRLSVDVGQDFFTCVYCQI